MSRDINNLKEIANSILEDIQVTDNLKLSTLKKCKEQKKNNFKPFFITAASISVIIFSIVSYKFIFHKPAPSLTYNNEVPTKSAKLNNEDNKYSDSKKAIDSNNSDKTASKKQTQQNNQSITKNTNTNKTVNSSSNNTTTSTTSDNNKAKDNSVNSSLPENKPKISSAENTENTKLNNNTTVNINEANIAESAPQSASSKDTIANDNPILRSALSDSSNSISIADAESFWGGKLLMPSYIPDGFELTDISLPKSDSKEIYVKLNYSFKNIYFKVLQNKNTTSTSYTGKVVDINGSKAYITKSKDISNPSIITTEIDFIKNNVQYNITGNLQEDELVKIAKSIN